LSKEEAAPAFLEAVSMTPEELEIQPLPILKKGSLGKNI